MSDEQPTTLGAAIRHLESIREKLATLKEQMDLLEKDRKAAEKHIYLQMSEQDIDYVKGERCSIRMVDQDVPRAADWETLYEHIRATGEFDLLHRRLSSGAFKERWMDGDSIPGAKKESLRRLTIRSS